jgi:hypothetical protein
MTGKKVRYVIDYYSSRADPVSEPVFHLDVRPASDCLDNVRMRVQRVVVDNASAWKVVFVALVVMVSPSVGLLYRYSLIAAS